MANKQDKKSRKTAKLPTPPPESSSDDDDSEEAEEQSDGGEFKAPPAAAVVGFCPTGSLVSKLTYVLASRGGICRRGRVRRIR